MTPRIVLFDVMDTLVHDPVWEVLPALFGRSLEELRALRHPDAWERFERAEIDAETFARIYVTDPQVRWDYDELVDRMCQGYQLIEGIAPLLDELQRANVPMAALSNYPTWWRFIEDKLALSRWLDWRFVSCMTGVRKPDPDAFLGAARALELVPEACLFVDDREVNVRGAREVGMQAVRFEDARQLRQDLVHLGLLPHQQAPTPG